jgi:hypothetical protein
MRAGRSWRSLRAVPPPRKRALPPKARPRKPCGAARLHERQRQLVRLVRPPELLVHHSTLFYEPAFAPRGSGNGRGRRPTPALSCSSLPCTTGQGQEACAASIPWPRPKGGGGIEWLATTQCHETTHPVPRNRPPSACQPPSAPKARGAANRAPPVHRDLQLVHQEVEPRPHEAVLLGLEGAPEQAHVPGGQRGPGGRRQGALRFRLCCASPSSKLGPRIRGYGRARDKQLRCEARRAGTRHAAAGPRHLRSEYSSRRC